jgi:hypothetical protein
MMTKTTIRSNTKRKQDLGLTVPVATRQARRIVDAVMPGVMVFVESKLSHDLANDVATVITTVSFPTGDLRAVFLFADLARLSNQHGEMRYADSSIVITRKVK